MLNGAYIRKAYIRRKGLERMCLAIDFFMYVYLGMILYIHACISLGVLQTNEKQQLSHSNSWYGKKTAAVFFVQTKTHLLCEDY